MNLELGYYVFENFDECVTWRGKKFDDNEKFDKFLKVEVANKVIDKIGRDKFIGFINSLSITGLSSNNIKNYLSVNNSALPGWKVSEALAETFLEMEQQIVFPWSNVRDYKNPSANLAGSDIVGLYERENKWMFVFGEVKSSSEKKYPPQVMSNKKEHMGGQLDSIIKEEDAKFNLIKWLYFRVKNTDFFESYQNAVLTYVESESKHFLMVGVLVRDTEVDENDLSKLGNKLRNEINLPTKCNLIALYLPWDLKHLANKVSQRGEL
ncbi:MAG: hypothetical protein M0R38_12130 [Bacteroidia bacterium]|nr:hypothetical protein [Bacteroidia bacterium]